MKTSKVDREGRCGPAVIDPCPCDLGLGYDVCCGPLHRGVRAAPDPAALMRSRYSAYVKREVGYLWRTLHPSHEDRAAGEAAFRRALQPGLRALRYRGLVVCESRAGADEGQVLFCARVFAEQVARESRRGSAVVDQSFVELSTFLTEPQGWFYHSGQPLLLSALPAGAPAGLTIAAFEALWREQRR